MLIAKSALNGRARYYDLWYDTGPGGYPMVAAERLEKSTDDRFMPICSDGGRQKRPSFDGFMHMQKRAREITPNGFSKYPKTFVMAVKVKSR